MRNQAWQIRISILFKVNNSATSSTPVNVVPTMARAAGVVLVHCTITSLSALAVQPCGVRQNLLNVVRSASMDLEKAGLPASQEHHAQEETS